MIAQALWHTSSVESVINKIEIGEISDDQLLVKSMFSLISNGTERLVCKGDVPVEIRKEMVVPYMGGSFEFPVKYGYSLVGEVIDGRQDFIGKLVHLMHPHQDYAICREEDVYIIPENVLPRRAALASNLETAVNAVWDSYISIGDNVLIAGFGMVGALTGIIMKNIPGVKVFIYDPDRSRISLAEKLGFTIFQGDFTFQGKFDITVNSSANSEGLQLCIDKAGSESRILELSWYGNQSVLLNLGGGFHKSRKQIISSQVSAIPGSKQAHWSFRRRKELVFDLLKNDWFDHLLTRDFPFEELPSIFDKLRLGANESGIVINYK